MSHSHQVGVPVSVPEKKDQMKTELFMRNLPSEIIHSWYKYTNIDLSKRHDQSSRLHFMTVKRFLEENLETIALAATRVGDTVSLDYLKVNGCFKDCSFMDELMVKCALRGRGNLDSAKWLYRNGVKLTHQHFFEAQRDCGHHILNWLKEENCPGSEHWIPGVSRTQKEILTGVRF